MINNTGNIIIPILIVLGIVLFLVFIFRGDTVVTTVESETTEEQIQTISDYRTEIINSVVEHACIWFKWDPEKIRTTGGVSPEDQGIVRLIHENEELFITFIWNKHRIILQYLDYDTESDTTVTYTESIKFSNNQVDWYALHKFVKWTVDDRLKDIPVEELTTLAIKYSLELAQNPENKEKLKPMLFQNIMNLYEYIIKHNIRDKTLIRTLSALICYSSQTFSEEFVQFLKELVPDEEENNNEDEQ